MSAITSTPALGSMNVSRKLNIIRRHPLVSYYVLTLVISGLIASPMIAVTQGWTNAQVPFALHYFGALGPMFAALIMTAYMSGTEGLRELWSRITRWQVGWVGFIGGVVLPLVLFVVGALVVIVQGGAFPDLSKIGIVNYLPDLGVWVLLLWLVTFGFGEEIGWRGFALPRLQKEHSALTATFIVWLMWAGWHLQYFLYLDTYVKMGLGMFPIFALGILAGAIILTWLYNETQGSVFIVAIWHTVFDLLSAAKISEGTIAMIMSIGVMVWAVVVLVWFKPKNLARAERHTV